jgi:opacity protein-like surface antigen
MKKHLFPFTILCLLSLQTFAQNQLNFSMKAGALSGKPKLTSKEDKYDPAKKTRDGGSSFSMAFSLPIKNKFRIGAELGFNNFNPDIDGNILYEGQFSNYFKGSYSINQTYLVIVPEYRIKDVLFVNAGLGFVKDITSAFTSGYRLNSGNTEDDIRGWEFKRDEAIGYFVGLGICPNLTDNLALLGEIRFAGSPANLSNDFAIQMGYTALNINIGLMYKPK